jgi:hypothetical protein
VASAVVGLREVVEDWHYHHTQLVRSHQHRDTRAPRQAEGLVPFDVAGRSLLAGSSPADILEVVALLHIAPAAADSRHVLGNYSFFSE